ncbi:MAG: replicative DNA helicase [Planctomycetota bacterium]|nr:MAG: replicative DNA helicase [Planctomycetota bacterium]
MSADPFHGKTPPHNSDAERSLLGALLLESDRMVEVADVVRPEDFYERRNGLVFDAMLGLAERSTPIDPVSVGEALRARGQFQEVGGNEHLLELLAAVTSTAHATYHARVINETALLRRLAREAQEIVGAALDARPDGDSVANLLDESEHRIFSLNQSRDRSDAKSMEEILVEAMKRIDMSRGGPSGIVTGYYDLDAKTCGLNKGDMIVIAARPGMGKTAMALNLLERAALHEQPALGHPAKVLMFSLEMGQIDLVQRMLGARAGVESMRMREKRLSMEERDALVSAADELNRAQVWIDDSPGMTMLALRSRARRHMHKHGLDMIVVDYLQLMSHPKAESRQMEISYISRSLKGLARELEIPVIALAQLNRGLEVRAGGDKTPRLADLRESGSIEQDADMVVLLHRPEKYLRPEEVTEEVRGLAELHIAKHRNGPTGIVKLQFFDSTMRFENRSPVVEPVAP